MEQSRRSVSGILAVLFGLGMVVFIALFVWAFAGQQDYKNNVDQKVAEATVVAVQEAESAKDVEFLEKEKKPYETYRGSSTYGSLSFEYPKTWSLYVEESTSGTVLDLYAHPVVVHDTSADIPYAFRVEITSRSYDTELSSFESDIEKGVVRAEAFRASSVPDALGVKLTGEIDRNIQGVMVLLPLRDRTIKLFTESTDFANDFNSIILPQLSFIP